MDTQLYERIDFPRKRIRKNTAPHVADSEEGIGARKEFKGQVWALIDDAWALHLCTINPIHILVCEFLCIFFCSQ